MKTNFLTQNAKLKKTSKITGIKTYDFAIPARKTCPNAKDCLEFCYASKGAYTWPAARNKHQANLDATKDKNFVALMIAEVERKKIEAVRIHSAGDFYNKTYLGKWVQIAMQMPNVTFYAYTKSIHLFKDKDGKNLKIPKNLVIIYSFGGKLDHLIDVKKDRHSIVYDGDLPRGYAYANDNDHVALAKNKKIGLKKH